ncbi:MAG: hypothetical protein HC901_04345 [Bdellovibrionaceae bacterium]|nr:hypothetical protein [Pseudobdellovibrionaceae bacterium]
MVEEAIYLQGGRVVDPARRVDATGEVWLHGGQGGGGGAGRGAGAGD